MKRNLILLLVLVLVGAVACWLYTERGTGTLAGPLADFAVQDTSAVSRIFIAEHSGKSVDLVRTEQGWRVNGAFGVKKHHLDLLLKTFLRAEVRSPVPKSAEANVLKAMSTTAKRVEIYEGGTTPTKIWLVGHATQEHFGTYMLLEVPGIGRSTTPYIMGMSGFTGHLNSRFHADLDEWRNSEIFAYPDLDAITSIKVEHPADPALSFTIAYGGGNDLTLKDATNAPVSMDSLAVKDFLLQFKKLHYEYIDRAASPSSRDSVLASTPHTAITISDRSGASRSIKLWMLRPAAEGVDEAGTPLRYDVNRMHGLVADSLLVVVQRHLFDRVTIPLSDLRRN